eukprot:UN27922
MKPITAEPSSAPSFIGLVLSVQISTAASSALDEAEVETLIDMVAQGYGVNPEDLTSVTEYVATGTMIINIPNTMSEDDVLSALTSSIADNLGVDEKSITLSIDPESGGVRYSVTTTDFEETATILEQLQDPSIVDDLTSNSGIIVSEIASDDGILAEVNVIVNADE